MIHLPSAKIKTTKSGMAIMSLSRKTASLLRLSLASLFAFANSFASSCGVMDHYWPSARVSFKGAK